MSMLDTLADKSPLIRWLLNILPFLVKGVIIAGLITLIAGRLFTIESVWTLGILIFIITTAVQKLAPGLLYGLEHGLGFAIALLIVKGF